MFSNYYYTVIDMDCDDGQLYVLAGAAVASGAGATQGYLHLFSGEGMLSHTLPSASRGTYLPLQLNDGYVYANLLYAYD